MFIYSMQKERQERRRVKQGMGIVPEDESRKSRFEPPPESVPPPKPQGKCQEPNHWSESLKRTRVSSLNFHDLKFSFSPI